MALRSAVAVTAENQVSRVHTEHAAVLRQVRDRCPDVPLCGGEGWFTTAKRTLPLR